MHECIKEKCRHWQRANYKGCSLVGELAAECLKTGEFQHRKPKERAAEWEDIKPFTALDLAAIGVDHLAIAGFCGDRPGSLLLTSYSASAHADALIRFGIMGCLVRSGYVRQSAPFVKPGDCFESEGERFMAVSYENAPRGVVFNSDQIQVVDQWGYVRFIDVSELTPIHN